MSELTAAQRKWRDQGSLRFLADLLGVTAKQVSRYWDNDWIEGAYSTSKGHRRVRYTDDTVQQVAAIVNSVKATNKAIRYHIDTIDYCGTVIPVKGCTKMQDVYRRARKVGLNDQDAKNAAYDLRGPENAALQTNLEWEYLLARQRTSQVEVAERMNVLSSVPALYLCQAQDATEFRARSRDAWQRLLSAKASREGSPCSSPDVDEKNRKIRDILRPLFHQHDRESFLAAFNTAAELNSRIFEEAPIFQKVKAAAEAKPGLMLLQIAALSLRRFVKAPTAAALAQALGISRRALYRTYGKIEIQQTLNSLRNDAKAICETPTDRKKSNTIAAKRDE